MVASLLTQCPHCQTIFRVTQEVLAVADGEVRCGRCGAPFDGIKGFIDHHQLLAARRSSNLSRSSSSSGTTSEYAATRPIHNQPAAFPLKQPAIKEPAKEATSNKAPEAIATVPAPRRAISVESTATPVAPVVPPPPAKPTAPLAAVPTEPVVTAKAAVADDAAKDVASHAVAKDKASDMANDLANMERVLQRPKKPSSGVWKFIVPPLLVLLGVQIVHYFRQDIANDPRFGPPLIALYTELGLYLAPHWRLKEYEVRQLGVLANPATPGTLRVRASITNRAKIAQPYPLLRLVLEDRFGQQVQAREFEPGEYAQGKFDGKSRLLPNQRIEANLTIVDPGTQAEGFRFDVCLRQPTGMFCADDEPVL